MKDGAHTHGDGGGGLGVLVAIGTGAVLASTVARLLPVLVIGAAVIAGWQLASVIIRTVMVCRWQSQASYWDVTGARSGQVTDTDLAGRDLVTLAQAIAELHAQLAAARGELPGPARHEHLHFYGLAAQQVAAVLAARQHTRPPDGGGQW